MIRYPAGIRMKKIATSLVIRPYAVVLAVSLAVTGALYSQTQRSDATQNADPEQRVAPAPANTPSDKARVTGLRFLSSPAYTRVMLDLSQEAKYEIRQLKEDPAKGTPPRIYIDISGARLALTSKEAVPVEDGLLKQIRIGQYSADVVRVVLDMHSLRAHNAFILPDPYRLVVDVQGVKAPVEGTAKEAPAKKPPAKRGAASHSYGIHVARLAGLPAGVIERAKQILAQLEGSQTGRAEGFTARRQISQDSIDPPAQMGLFSAAENRLRDQLNNLDVTRMTPMDALNLLHQLTEQAKK